MKVTKNGLLSILQRMVLLKQTWWGASHLTDRRGLPAAVKAIACGFRGQFTRFEDIKNFATVHGYYFNKKFVDAVNEGIKTQFGQPVIHVIGIGSNDIRDSVREALDEARRKRLRGSELPVFLERTGSWFVANFRRQMKELVLEIQATPCAILWVLAPIPDDPRRHPYTDQLGDALNKALKSLHAEFNDPRFDYLDFRDELFPYRNGQRFNPQLWEDDKHLNKNGVMDLATYIKERLARVRNRTFGLKTDGRRYGEPMTEKMRAKKIRDDKARKLRKAEKRKVERPSHSGERGTKPMNSPRAVKDHGPPAKKPKSVKERSGPLTLPLTPSPVLSQRTGRAEVRHSSPCHSFDARDVIKARYRAREEEERLRQRRQQLLQEFDPLYPKH